MACKLGVVYAAYLISNATRCIHSGIYIPGEYREKGRSLKMFCEMVTRSAGLLKP